jgi:hypothetical protein
MPSKRPEDNSRVSEVDVTLPRQPCNSSSTVPSLDSSHLPNSVDLHRFHDGHGRQEPIRDVASYPDKRVNLIRDDSSRLERQQLGPTDRRFEDAQRPSNISLDTDGRESLRHRASVNHISHRDSNYDQVKDEKPKEGSDKDVRPQFEWNNVCTL